MPKHKWTPTEIAILKRNYPTKGRDGVQRILQQRGYHRTKAAITNQATRRLLTYGQPPGLVPLAWLTVNGSGSHAKTQAQHDGVLHTLPSKPKYLVPEWWADEYAEDMRLRGDTRDWWTTHDIARRLNLAERSVRTALGPKRRQHSALGQCFRGVERRLQLQRPARMRYHPAQAERACGEYDRVRRDTRFKPQEAA